VDNTQSGAIERWEKSYCPYCETVSQFTGEKKKIAQRAK